MYFFPFLVGAGSAIRRLYWLFYWVTHFTTKQQFSCFTGIAPVILIWLKNEPKLKWTCQKNRPRNVHTLKLPLNSQSRFPSSRNLKLDTKTSFTKPVRLFVLTVLSNSISEWSLYLVQYAPDNKRTQRAHEELVQEGRREGRLHVV